MATRANQIQRSVTKHAKANDIAAAVSGDYPPDEAAITSPLNRPVRSYLSEPANRSTYLIINCCKSPDRDLEEA